MFYCIECAEKHNLMIIDSPIARSLGPCEYCGETKVCNDIPTGIAHDNDPKIKEELTGLAKEFEKLEEEQPINSSQGE